MESFFLSETLKYLYLLYDEDNFIHKGAFCQGLSLLSCLDRDVCLQATTSSTQKRITTLSHQMMLPLLVCQLAFPAQSTHPCRLQLQLQIPLPLPLPI
jgi:hypothetical protein